MNKLTKIGVSALCGSLASISAANAGSMEVLGGATATWSSNEGTVTGNSIGMHSGLTFKGSGELDNGTAFTLTITGADQAGYSSGSISMDTPSMGNIKIIGAAGGGGIDRFDDMMPTAWEETNGTSLATGLTTVGGVTGSMSIEWSPSSDMLPEGLAIHLAYAPKADGTKANDKASTGSVATVAGSGHDISVSYNGLVDGLNVFAGMSEIEQPIKSTGTSTTGDRTQYVMGATYAVGSVTVGYQQSRDNLQLSAIGATTNYYDNEAFGISFNVNDDLSISYGNHSSTRSLRSGTSVELEAESLQIAYTMGGASIKLAESTVDNGSYTSGTSKDRDGTTIALTLAF